MTGGATDGAEPSVREHDGGHSTEGVESNVRFLV